MTTNLPISTAPLLFFDIETTGLRPDRGGQITEMVAIDGNRVVYEWLAAAHGTLEASATRELPRLFRLIGASVLVGHNLAFDLSFLSYEAQRHRIHGPNVLYLDTLALARRVLAGAPDYRLETLLACLDLPVPVNLHTAEADAFATRDLFFRLIKLGNIESLDQAGLKRINWAI